MIAPTINTVGLILDVLGVALLFKYGVNRNPNLSPHGHLTGFIEGGGSKLDKQAKTNYWKYKKREDIGLYMLIIGFALQALSSWMPSIKLG